MPEQEQSGLHQSEQATQPDRGQPASQKQSEQEQDVGAYMANLGAGTGVDIGPGAAGEMGGAAQEPKLPIAGKQGEEYPDSGDLPHLNSTNQTS
jgi:hypothetical protein